jgi:TfoX/Sxy family transcriptional regulator of competence genes
MPYWSIPRSVRADEERLIAWARDALEVARAAKR